MATPHNSAENGQFAKTVLMPGDPLRAKWVAENFLEEARLVTGVRNVYGYTGKYKGKEVSVMASGMGMPSIGIYSYELYKFYDVSNIIRIGSAGSYSADVRVMDIVLASAAFSESTFGEVQNGDKSDMKYPSGTLNELIENTASDLGLEKKLHVGLIHSSDVFYREENGNERADRMTQEKGLLCVEMESFALFHNAQVLGKHAACLLTISDSLVTGEELNAQERQESFVEMVKLALETAIRA